MKRIAAHRACGLLYRFVKHYPGIYLLPANVCPVVPLTLSAAGVLFEFVDIDATTLCMNEQTCLEKLRSDMYAGVVFVRTYGYMHDVDSFINVVHQLGKKVVDDRCLCMPELALNSAKADMVLYSTGYAKCVDFGEGAFAYIQDDMELSLDSIEYKGIDIEEIYKPKLKAKQKIFNIPKGWLDTTLGLSDDYFERVEAILPKIKSHKDEINRIYYDLLPSEICLENAYQQWRFHIHVREKDSVLRAIFDNGGFASSHYQPSSCLFTDEIFPNAEQLYVNVINLFNDKYISTDMANKIAKIIMKNE